MKTVVVIPTYNEKENIVRMVEAVLANSDADHGSAEVQGTAGKDDADRESAKASELELLVVDDNSPDGTGDIVEALMKSEPRLHCLHRTAKEGLGRAYIAGFREALALGADCVIQMDCDFSHDPKDIPRLLAAMVDLTRRDPIAAPTRAPQGTPVANDPARCCAPQGTPVVNAAVPALVIGSRYVRGGATPGWPFKRRLISRCGGLFIRVVTGMPLRDPTGGFKCWSRAALEGLDLETVESAGYSFQLEMNHRSWKRGFAIREIPIIFTDRVAGASKITAGIAVESIKIALRLRFGKKRTSPNRDGRETPKGQTSHS